MMPTLQWTIAAVALLLAELAKRPQPARSAPEAARKNAPAPAAARARLHEDEPVPIVIGRSGFAETQVMEWARAAGPAGLCRRRFGPV